MSPRHMNTLRSIVAWVPIAAGLGVLLASAACAIALQNRGHANELWWYSYDPARHAGPGPTVARIGLVVRNDDTDRRSLICGFPLLWLEIRDTHGFDQLVHHAPTRHTLEAAERDARVRVHWGALGVNALLLGAPAAAVLAALRRRRKPFVCLLVLCASGWITYCLALVAWMVPAPGIGARSQVHGSAESLERATGVELNPQPSGTAFDGFHRRSLWLDKSWYSYTPYEEVGGSFAPNGRAYSWSRTGLPFRCLANGDKPDIWWQVSPDMASMYARRYLLTCRAMPIPFVANTLLIALVLGGTVPAWRAVRRRRRTRRGLCTQCAYPLATLPDPICPECGSPVSRITEAPP
ncbi:MAG: hypothetical protein KF838_11605 [Phycisphaeraceae bacterium]|nr:MAG: hypothetical protein KF838_11605 [Phycisphaeraceae bacterium]